MHIEVRDDYMELWDCEWVTGMGASVEAVALEDRQCIWKVTGTGASVEAVALGDRECIWKVTGFDATVEALALGDRQ